MTEITQIAFVTKLPQNTFTVIDLAVTVVICIVAYDLISRMYHYVFTARTTLGREDAVYKHLRKIDNSEGVPADFIETVPSEDQQLHNKVNRTHHKKYLRTIVQALKLEFGQLAATNLNIKTVRHAATRMMTQHGVRHAHQFQLMSKLLPLVFTLTDDEIEMERQFEDLRRPLYVPDWLRSLLGHGQAVDRAYHGVEN